MISLTDKYTYRVIWSEEDGEFVASPQAALKGIRAVVSDCANPTNMRVNAPLCGLSLPPGHLRSQEALRRRSSQHRQKVLSHR